MRTFEYRGFDSGGKSRKGLIEALDVKQAREKLTSAGILAEKVHPAELIPSKGIIGERNPFNRDRRALFYRELASLLNAGLPLTGALEAMLRAPDFAAAGTTMAVIRDKIREGAALAAAIAESGNNIHPAETSFIVAGEKSGELEWALTNLAGFMDEETKLRQRVITALIYPSIIVCLALGIAVGLLGFTVPRLTQVLTSEMNISLPLITRIMIGLGRAVVRFGPFLLAAMTALGFAAWRFIMRRPEHKRVVDRFLFNIPVVGKCYTTLAALRFSRTLGLLLRGGVPLVASVDLAGQATGSISIMAQCDREAEAIRNGASLSEALARIYPLGAHLAGIIQIGESSGALERVLKGAEERYQNRWEQQLSRVMAWFEPALILAVGFFVLLVVVSILLPILTLNRQLL